MKRIVVCLIALCLAFSVCACGQGNTDGKMTLYDVRGREVVIEKDVQRVVCIGASALRLFAYVGDMEMLVGVEEFEKGAKMPVRPYAYGKKEVFSGLPSVGAGGPKSTPNAEAILAVKPDVVFSLYDDVALMDELEDKLGIPVVCLSYGGADPFSEQVTASLRILGKILNREARAESVIDAIFGFWSDLQARTKGILEEEKPTAFLACNTYNGGKGSFGDTLVNFSAFDAVNAKNALSSEAYATNNPTVDYETLLALDPEFIFVDAMNVGALKGEMEEHREVFSALSAFRENKVFMLLPVNQYYTNLEIAVANAYAVGKALFPEAFSDVDLKTEFDKICSAFLQEELAFYEITVGLLGRGYGAFEG